MKTLSINHLFTGLVIMMISVQLNAQVTLDLKVFLEGPFNGTTMNTDMNNANLLPLNQPYNVSPWNYPGTEQVGSIPNPDIVDWILIELRETSGDAFTATPDSIIHRQAAFLKSDGNVVDIDGSSLLTYSGSITENLYVIIWHRNHLAVMSSGPLIEAGGIYSWDFTDLQAKAYLDGQKDIGGGKFGMIGGDCNSSGRVNSVDEDVNWSREAGNAGYYSGDANLDTQVNNIDKDDVWYPNNGEIVQLPEGVIFYCGAEMLDGRDGQFYNTVLIGAQCWMAENLNVGDRIDGIGDQTDNTILEKYCYDDLESNCDTYGGLYQWDEMMQYVTSEGTHGICPDGWHLPKDGDWCTLTQFIDPTVDCYAIGFSGTDAAYKMKSTSGWKAGGNGNDQFSFTALPGGFRYDDGSFTTAGEDAGFWSSTEFSATNSFSRNLYYDYLNIGRFSPIKSIGFSVRCIKDSPPQTWSCGDTINDNRNGQIYNTVQIGDQCWMAENMNIGTMINGSNNQSQQNPEVIEKYCYNNDPANCDTYGGLYQWNEMMQYTTTQGVQGICPPDWHLPTDEEWKQLEGAVDSQYGYPDPEWDGAGLRGFDAGLNLKSESGWYSGGNGTDLYGFTALPGGLRNSDGTFGSLTRYTGFWSSSESGSHAWDRNLDYIYAQVYRFNYSKAHGFSARCLKDEEPPTWSCGDDLNDIRDSQTYTTIQIGTQCWMAENLNIGTMINGNGDQIDNGIIEKYCYNNEIDSCNKYGGFYQWNEMMQYSTVPGIQGICPDGWHIPTDDEWKYLEGVVDSLYPVGDPIWNTTEWRGYNIGKNLKSTSGWANNGNGTDLFGFNALASGYRQWSGNFVYATAESHFYTSTEYNLSNAVWRYLSWARDDINRHTNTKVWALSIRCIKTPPNMPPDQPANPNPPDGAINQSINTILSWTCTDPENDPLTFDVYFGTEADPPLIASGIIQFNFDPNPLEGETVYFWKIVAKDNFENIHEGPLWSFTTGLWQCTDPFTDTRNDQIYNTTLIGDQCWMAENLNIGTMITGSPIDNGIIEKKCYNNVPDSCDIYGGLYPWYELMDYTTTPAGQGICPDGWHVPTDNEWKYLEGTVDSQYGVGDPIWTTGDWRGYDVAYKLKATTGWVNDGNGSDIYGFSALPGGYAWLNGMFLYGFVEGHFATSSQAAPANKVYMRYMSWARDDINRHLNWDNWMISVRCLKYVGVSNSPPDTPSNPVPPDGAVYQSINPVLGWAGGDPDNDPVTFDVYLGVDPDPPMVVEGLTDQSYSATNLNDETVYYWKIVAQDDHANITIGPIWSFTTEYFICGIPIIDPRDGQIYNTILIGDQCWMAENLNIGTRIDGTGDQTNNSIIEKYCYDNLESNCDTFGGLYQWNEMMQYITTQGVQGICPTDWHIPTDNEYTILTDYLGGLSIAGGKMKETGTVHWYSPNTGATNESGFTALPGGYRHTDGGFHHLSTYAYFWSSRDYYGSYAYERYLYYNTDDVYPVITDQYCGLSVRCLKD